MPNNKVWAKNNREKKLAQDAAIRKLGPTKPAGMTMHHWSYAIEHRFDVFFIDRANHHKIHLLMEYDKELRKYRIKETGELLDTREKHEAFMNSILDHSTIPVTIPENK